VLLSFLGEAVLEDILEGVVVLRSQKYRRIRNCLACGPAVLVEILVRASDFVKVPLKTFWVEDHGYCGSS